MNDSDVLRSPLALACGRAPRAMVLAAGLGTRLRPLTDQLPKPLVPLLGRPLLTYNLRLLRSLGVREVVVNVHHHATALIDALGDGAALGLQLRWSVEEQLLGTGGGVRRVLDWLTEYGTGWLLNGDTVVDGDLRGAWLRHRACGAAATLLLHEHPDALRHGAVGLAPDRRIIGIGRLLGEPPTSPYLFAGVHLIEPGLLTELKPGQPSCIIRQGYLPALLRGAAVLGDSAVSFWADLGTPARYLAAHRVLLARPELCAAGRPAVNEEPPPSGVRLRLPAFLGRDVQVEGAGEAVIGPDATVGDGVRLAAGARLERCVVWPGARVEGDLFDAVVLSDGTRVAAEGDVAVLTA